MRTATGCSALLKGNAVWQLVSPPWWKYNSLIRGWYHRLPCCWWCAKPHPEPRQSCPQQARKLPALRLRWCGARRSGRLQAASGAQERHWRAEPRSTDFSKTPHSLFSCSRGGGREAAGYRGVVSVMQCGYGPQPLAPCVRRSNRPARYLRRRGARSSLINWRPDLRNMKEERRQMLNVLVLPFSLASWLWQNT